MTAKSRRHKLDKRRKSDEHPQPRRREEADRRKEGTRGRTGLRAVFSIKDEIAALDGSTVIREAELKSVSLVREGEGIPGSFIEFDDEGLIPLNEVDPREYDILQGYPQGAKLYLNDFEKEVLEEAQRDFDEKRAGSQEAVRTAGASDDATAS